MAKILGKHNEKSCYKLSFSMKYKGIEEQIFEFCPFLTYKISPQNSRCQTHTQAPNGKLMQPCSVLNSCSAAQFISSFHAQLPVSACYSSISKQ